MAVGGVPSWAATGPPVATRTTANVAPASGACRTERAAVDNLRLGTARGPTPGFDARLGDGSTVRVDLPHGTNDALLRLRPGDILPVQVWQGTAVRIWIDGQGYATSDNPTQQAGAWLQGAQMGALALWLPLLAGAWLALRGWILSREPTDDEPTSASRTPTPPGA